MSEKEFSLQSLHLYPIKGFRGVDVDQLHIRNNAIVDDRKYAFLFLDALKDEISDFYKVNWLDKGKLLVQNDWPSLAQIKLQSNQQMSVFEFLIEGKKAQFDFRIEKDRQECAKLIFDFVSKQTPSKAARHPKVTELMLIGDTHQTRFPDRGKYALSILNLASLRDLEKQVGYLLEIERFRGNIIIDTGEPWSELDLVDQKVKIGNALIEIQKPIGRCHNINVHPKAGSADVKLLESLHKLTEKTLFGVMADVPADSIISIADKFSILD